MVDFFFKTPAALPSPVVVGIAPGATDVKGELKAVCPEELRHAFVLAIARDIKLGLPMEKWLHLTLTTVFEFIILESDDDFFWKATSLREAMGAKYEAMYYTTVRASRQSQCMSDNSHPSDYVYFRSSGSFRSSTFAYATGQLTGESYRHQSWLQCGIKG